MTRLPFSALDWLTWAAEMAAQAAVLVTARRLPRPRPHVSLFVGVLVAEVWMRVTQELLFVGSPAITGPLRALYHVETALVAAWPAAVAALAWWCFRGPQKLATPGSRCSAGADRQGPRAVPESAGSAEGIPSFATPNNLRGGLRIGGLSRSLCRANEAFDILLTLPLAVKAIAAAWLTFNAALVLAYPLSQGKTQPILHAWQGAMVLCAAAAIVRGWARRREHAAQVAFALAAIELAVATVGPYAGNVFAAWRTVGAGMYAVGFSLIAVWQWRARQSPRP